MAAPVASASPNQLALNPGQSLDVTVTASDPDSKSGTVDLPTSDSQGNVTVVHVTVVIDDPLTFGGAVVPPELEGLTVQRISATATTAVYRFTAP